MTLTNVTMAQEHYGDVNYDGVLTAADSAAVMQYVLNKNAVDFDADALERAAVLGNPTISAADSVAILQKVLDNAYVFPVLQNETTTQLDITQTTTVEPTTEVTTKATTTTESTTKATTTEATTEPTTKTTTTETTTEATTVENGILVNNHYYYIGEKANSLPAPTRTEVGADGYNWYVYADDYSQYIKVGVIDGVVKKLYTTAKGFSVAGYTDGMTCTDTKTVSIGKGVSLIPYVDSVGGNVLYGIALKDISCYESNTFNSNTIAATNNEIFDITNAYRVKNGLEPYKEYGLLGDVAQNYAEYMAENSHFSHTDLNGNKSSQRITSAGINWSSCGENIATGYTSPEQVMDGWINSSGHRSNLLNTKYEYLGVGTAYNPDDTLGYKTRFVQNFCSVF